ISKRSGDGIYNLTFKDITVNGTGKEFPNNNALNRNWGRGFFVLIAGSPGGNGTYCNMNYSNRGGNATANEEISAIGTFSWTQSSNCSTTSIAVTGVTITPTTATLNVGATQQLTPAVAPANATNKTVSYSSNNTGVATVNSGGLITAIASGSATITVTTQDGAKTAVSVITVNSSNAAVTSVSLSPATVSISVGETQQLTPTILPSNATNKTVSYASNNTGVATVNAAGLVTAVSNGTATITVTTADGNKTNTSAITVSTATGNYFTIKNRWTNTYLYDAGANVGYGATVANNNYKWQKVAVDATYFILKNVGTGDIMHIENLTGAVQCTAGQSTWWSAQWSNENVDGTWVRIRNRWQTGSMIHIENLTGNAQYSGAQNNWESAQWQFQTTSTAKKLDTNKTEVLTENNILVTIYPNPAINNEFNILLPELKADDVAIVTVTDMNGRKILVHKLNTSAKINHNLAAGIYIVTINSNVINVSKKLIIK
ncbi:MAG: Ig-like domain-containing protein, partial [Flavobacterium sp.]